MARRGEPCSDREPSRRVRAPRIPEPRCRGVDSADARRGSATVMKGGGGAGTSGRIGPGGGEGGPRVVAGVVSGACSAPVPGMPWASAAATHSSTSSTSSTPARPSRPSRPASRHRPCPRRARRAPPAPRAPLTRPADRPRATATTGAQWSGPTPSDGSPVIARLSVPALGVDRLVVEPYEGWTDDAPGTRIQDGGHAASSSGRRGARGQAGWAATR